MLTHTVAGFPSSALLQLHLHRRRPRGRLLPLRPRRRRVRQLRAPHQRVVLRDGVARQLLRVSPTGRRRRRRRSRRIGAGNAGTALDGRNQRIFWV